MKQHICMIHSYHSPSSSLNLQVAAFPFCIIVNCFSNTRLSSSQQVITGSVFNPSEPEYYFGGVDASSKLNKWSVVECEVCLYIIVLNPLEVSLTSKCIVFHLLTNNT